MHVIPAIDLMNGNIVRLSRGDPKTAKSYCQFGGPVETANRWKQEGAEKLHIIDLDAAFGLGNNLELILEIANSLSLPIQVGGGLRKTEDIERMLRLGINQVILGALAFSEPQTLTRIQKTFGESRVIVALDNRDGQIMIEGWKTPTGSGVKEAMEKFTSLGISTFLVTSITKDGMLSGPDVETLSEACKHVNAKVIAAGGIGSLDDLAVLKKIGITSVVIGKALYEGRFTLREAIKTVGGT